jgi:hypothetical protein
MVCRLYPQILKRSQVLFERLHPSGTHSRMRRLRNEISILFISTASMRCNAA